MYSVISGNSSGSDGGGVLINATDVTLSNVIISNNTTEQWGCGGGISILEDSSPWESKITINNSIIWGNSVAGPWCLLEDESIYYFPFNDNYSYDLLITYCDIEGGWEGEGNIDANPLFTDSENEDYTLSWFNYPVEDETMSPCIDAGTADTDGDGYEDMEYCGDAPDMGAFEYITEDCEESTLSGDLNGDGLINVLDVVMLVDIVLGNADPVSSGDLNGDGVLNVLDIVMLVDIILGL